MTASIRKRKYKSGVSYQVVLEKGFDSTGKRLREYISCGSKSEAEKMKAQKLHEYNIGAYIEPSKITVEELCEQWYAVYVEPKLATNTKQGYKVNLEKHIYPYIGGIPLQKLTPVQIQNIYDSMMKNGFAPRTVQYVHTTLREALEYAYKMQIVGRNMADFVSKPKLEKYRAETYTEQEAIQLLEACKNTKMNVPVNLALGLGLRRGEVLGLQWSDIDFKNNTVHICHNLICNDGEKEITKPKTESSERTLLIPEHIVAILRLHKISQAKQRLKSSEEYIDNDLVCCRSDGNPYHSGSFSQSFSAFLKSNNLKHIRFHDLRHTNATLMLKYGVPAKIASERLGHSNIQTTMNIYSHVSVDMQHDAANVFDDKLFSKIADA